MTEYGFLVSSTEGDKEIEFEREIQLGKGALRFPLFRYGALYAKHAKSSQIRPKWAKIDPKSPAQAKNERKWAKIDPKRLKLDQNLANSLMHAAWTQVGPISPT